LGARKLMDIFGKKFGLRDVTAAAALGAGVTAAPRPNVFDNLTGYFLQKAIPRALAEVVDAEGFTPDTVIAFLVDLLKYNDNSSNTVSDNYYLAEIIQALGRSLARGSPLGALEAAPPRQARLALLREARTELDRYIGIERILPYFQNTVM